MIYLVRNATTGNIKIGYTSHFRAEHRMRDLQVGNDCDLDLVCVMEGSEEDEKLLHVQLKAHWIRGEWFKGDAVLSYMEDINYDTIALPPITEQLDFDNLPNYTHMRCCNILHPGARHFRTESGQLIVPIPKPTCSEDGWGITTLHWYWEHQVILMYDEARFSLPGSFTNVRVLTPAEAGYSRFRWRQIEETVAKWTPPEVEDNPSDYIMSVIQKHQPHPDLVGIR